MYVVVEWRLDSQGEPEFIYQDRKGRRSFTAPPADEKHCWKTQMGAVQARNKIVDDLGYGQDDLRRLSWTSQEVHLTPALHDNTTGRFIRDRQDKFWKAKILSNQERIDALERLVDRLESALRGTVT